MISKYQSLRATARQSRYDFQRRLVNLVNTEVKEIEPPESAAKARLSLTHLISAMGACGIAASILIAGRMAAIHLEESTLPLTASQLFPLKTQGLAFQCAAARDRNVLLLYGSSELTVAIPDKASEFFRAAPTGFQVSPVGKSGATSITILQKLGALGSELSGRKVTISISPEWFLAPGPRLDWYRGNFSLAAANQLAFGRSLDFELKHEIACRMLQFPGTLEKSPLLEFAFERLASSRWMDHVVFFALWPIGRMQNALLDLQDHFEALLYLSKQKRDLPHVHRQVLNWFDLVAHIDERQIATQKEKEEEKRGLAHPLHRREPGFVARLNTAPEWMDFELLLRVLKKIRARPLLVSMPLDGEFYDETGVSLSARENYYRRVRAAAQRYGFPLVEFEKHDDDPTFIDGQHTHFTAKGWMFCNRVLDEFFHRRVPQSW